MPPLCAELAGEEDCSSEKKRLQHFNLVFSIFRASNFNIFSLQFQQFEIKY